MKEILEKKFGAAVSFSGERRVWVEIDAAGVRDAVQFVKDQGFDHLSTITGLDLGEKLQFLYHFAKGGTVLTLKAGVSAENPAVQTITDLFPGAESYERELVDMFGAKVDGLKPGNRYPLPDDWPSGQHPLRKSWKPSALYPQEEKNG